MTTPPAPPSASGWAGPPAPWVVPLVLLALAGVVIAHLAWAADAVLRDEDRFAAVLGGALVREPLRAEVAGDLTVDLPDDAESLFGEPLSPASRRTLETAAADLAASPALDPTLHALAAWVAGGVVGPDVSPVIDLPDLWPAYAEAVAVHDAALGAAVARRAADGPTPEEIAAALPGPADERGLDLAGTLAWVAPVPFLGFAVALVALIGAVAGTRSRGRGIAFLIALPGALTALVALGATSGHAGWFAFGSFALAALPAAAATGALAAAVLLARSRTEPVDRSRLAAGELPPSWIGSG